VWYTSLKLLQVPDSRRRGERKERGMRSAGKEGEGSGRRRKERGMRSAGKEGEGSGRRRAGEERRGERKEQGGRKGGGKGR
jgi:hypothetical protein